MTVSFDQLVSGDSHITAAATRRGGERQESGPDARHARRGPRSWPYRRHLVLGALTGVLVAVVGATYALILWEVLT